jgi:hypothetical protein
MVRRRDLDALASLGQSNIGSSRWRRTPLPSRLRIKCCIGGVSTRPMWRATSLLFFQRSRESFKPASELGARFCREDGLSCRLCDGVNRVSPGFCGYFCFAPTLYLEHGSATLISARPSICNQNLAEISTLLQRGKSLAATNCRIQKETSYEIQNDRTYPGPRSIFLGSNRNSSQT